MLNWPYNATTHHDGMRPNARGGRNKNIFGLGFILCPAAMCCFIIKRRSTLCPVWVGGDRSAAAAVVTYAKLERAHFNEGWVDI
jgi:hypothetical protein